jgi:peptidoglycan/xylan/chitin deacetylase (PgdA/CDA1 family)
MREKLIQKDHVPILMYHSISETASYKFRPYAVLPDLFAEHMAYLYQQGYTPITVSHLVSAWTQQLTELPERPIVLTFDDGFADFFSAALPVLKQYHFTATLYIPTAFVDGENRWLYPKQEANRPMLTWKQLSEISASGIECGGHTHSHPQLDILPDQTAWGEISRSKKLLEEHLGQEICSFSYPFGHHTDRVRQFVRVAGYTSACSVRHAFSSMADDPFALPRLMVRRTTNKEEFALLLADRHSLPLKVAYRIYSCAQIPVERMVRRYTGLNRWVKCFRHH